MERNAYAPTTNRILGSLPEDEYQRLAPHLTACELTRGKIIYEIDEIIEYVYFPIRALISLVTQMEDGKTIEVGMIGSDGMTGLSALMGHPTSPERAFVQIPDGGVRAKFSVIQEEFKRGGCLHNRLLRYAHALLRQVAQTAACNATHSVEVRLARWLLMCRDQVQSDELKLTQEFIAEMLGTRRATVNVAAMTLQSANLIQYNRGNIQITDRQGLMSFSCECYEVLKKINRS